MRNVPLDVGYFVLRAARRVRSRALLHELRPKCPSLARYLEEELAAVAYCWPVHRVVGVKSTAALHFVLDEDACPFAQSPR